jgi:acyl carrier protein
MQDASTILGWVTEVLRSEFEFTPAELSPTTHLVDDLEFDSIDAVDMAVRLEEKSGFRLSEDELKSIQTIQDVVDLIHGHA